MANLAIKGHSTRGSEVIELLEMLGGKNTAHFKGEKAGLAYYIEVDKSICCIDIEFEYHTEFYKITVEEFEEKFPYKVGDEVIAYVEGCLAHFIIQDIRWNNKLNKIEYKICSSWCDTDLMQPYKEKTMETITIDDFKANTKEWLIDKLHGMIISDAVKTIGNIHDELHKPKYPKSYEECARLLNTYCGSIGGYNWKLLSYFQQLIICRDAYWKIAGEQMGLGKPWKPEYKEGVANTYYTIHLFNNKLFLAGTSHRNAILSFPTEEMRDAFYENFKELIDICKELL